MINVTDTGQSTLYLQAQGYQLRADLYELSPDEKASSTHTAVSHTAYMFSAVIEYVLTVILEVCYDCQHKCWGFPDKNKIPGKKIY